MTEATTTTRSSGNSRLHGEPPKLSEVLHTLSEPLKRVVKEAKVLYKENLGYFAHSSHTPPAYIAVAPGRVNLIGEHTDYTGGFVLPMALSQDYSTVVYGTGTMITGHGSGDATIRIRFCSGNAAASKDDPIAVEDRRIAGFYPPSAASDPRSWADYVVGTVVQYRDDLPPGCKMDLCFAITSSVPLGGGLSSSASLETAVAVFVECFMNEFAYSYTASTSEADQQNKNLDTNTQRALRCQKAENEWARAPCGIMDQMVISNAMTGNLLLIDCRDYSTTYVPMKMEKKKDDDDDDKTSQLPVVVISNSLVKHGIADGEYGKRRKQCRNALLALQAMPELSHIQSLRDATRQDVKDAKSHMNNTTTYKRAKHVVTENARTCEAVGCLQMGNWQRLGELMNDSHASLRDDFQVSCEEVDFMVNVAQNYDGVYGSRITGGGFGGCIVSLVERQAVKGFIKHLQHEYKAKFGSKTACPCFVTEPGKGARVLATDEDCMPESEFYKKEQK